MRRAARNDDFHDRILGHLAVLGVVKANSIVSMFGAMIMRPSGCCSPSNSGRSLKCQMQLCDIAIAAQPSNPVRKSDIEMLDADEIEKRSLRIRRGNNAIGLDLFAVGQLHAFGSQAIGTAVD